MTKIQINKLNVLKTQVMDWNAEYYGVDIYDWMTRAGKGIARILITSPSIPLLARRGRRVRVAFFCGLGNNGGDGFAAARYLDKKKFEPVVLLFGDPQDIRTEEASKHWEEMKEAGVETHVIASPAFLRDEAISLAKGLLRGKAPRNDRWDVVVDCLLGTGVKGKLREPIAGAVKHINTLALKHGAKVVAVDFPILGIKKVDLTISMQFAKVNGAEVVDLKPGAKFMQSIGPGEVKALNPLRPSSRKGDNGRLLIIAGSEQYHGVLLYTIKMASKIVDLVYVLTTPENQKLIQKLKSKTAEFITIDNLSPNLSPRQGRGAVYDCILIGPGMGKSDRTNNLVKAVLKSKKNAVLDADALRPEIKKYLHKNVILTPHRREYERMFGGAKLESVIKKYSCTIVLKGKTDIVANPDWGLKYNYTGNEGMTKGGTGDVLAGLIAGFYCRNDGYLSAAAGVFVNGLAGDELYKNVGSFYDAENLVKRIPRTLYKLITTPS